MINPTAGRVESGSGKGYGRYTFSLSDKYTNSSETKQDFQGKTPHNVGSLFPNTGIKKPIKSVVSRLVKLLSNYNQDINLNDVDIKLENKSPSGFITIFKTKVKKEKS